MNEDIPSRTDAASTPIDEAARAIIETLAHRRAGASICPTDAARHLSAARAEPGPDDWRQHLGTVRRAAQHLAQRGAIDILRKGKTVDPGELRGVIRLRLTASGSAPREET